MSEAAALPPDEAIDPGFVRNAYVALGSNLGDRISHLRAAMAALRTDPVIEVLAVAPVYESPAHVSDSSDAHPDFLNTVAKLSTPISAAALLRKLQRIEVAAGRRRKPDDRWMPRTLDLDLLIFGDEIIRQDHLVVPHPRMGARRFVLRPLADLAPDLRVPEPYGTTVGELLAACPDTDRPVKTSLTL